MPRQLRHPFPCLQSAGRRRLQQEFWRQRCGSRRLAFRHLNCSRQAVSRSLFERRLSRCFGGNSPIVRRPRSRCGLRGVALADSSLPTKARPPVPPPPAPPPPPHPPTPPGGAGRDPPPPPVFLTAIDDAALKAQ